MVTLGEILAECISFEQMLLEGKDPVEILHYKFGAVVPENIIDAVISIDPTKKKTYSQWTLLRYKDEPQLVKKSLQNGKLAKLFEYVREHKELQMKDIPSLSEALDNYVPDTDLVFSPSDSEEADDYETVYDDSEWRICVPNTYEADCKLGLDTKWCTANAYGNGESYWRRYANDGKLFVNFDKRQTETLNGKTFPYTRYQFHFESNSFMDAHDRPMSREEIDNLLPSEVWEFYENEGYEFEEDMETRRERYDEWRYNHSVCVGDTDLRFLPEWDDDMEIGEEGLNAALHYCLYDVDSDDRDPITYDIDFYCTANELNQENIITIIDNETIIFRDPTDTDDAYLLTADGEGRWRRNYNVCKLHQLIQVGSEYIILTENDHKYYLGIIREDGSIIEDIADDGKLFLNQQCSSTSDYYQYCVELTHTNGMSLYGIREEDYSIIEIIRTDFPANGEQHYTVDENGVVRGKFRRYKFITNEDDDEEYDTNRFQIIKQITDNSVLVEFGNGNKNIYSISQERVIGEKNFGYFYGSAFNCYVCQNDDSSYFVMNQEGKVISHDYKEIRVVDKQTPLFIGTTRKGSNYEGYQTLISPTKGELVEVGGTNGTLANGQYIAVRREKYTGYLNLYDLKNNQLMDNVQIASLTSGTCALDEEKQLVLINSGTDSSISYSVYNVVSKQVLVNGITKISLVTGGFYNNPNAYILKLADGMNIFDANERKLMLSTNYSNISRFEKKYHDYDNEHLNVCVCENNNKLDFYSVALKKMLFTMNNTDLVIPKHISSKYFSFYCKDPKDNHQRGMEYDFRDNQFYPYNTNIPINVCSDDVKAQYAPALEAMGFTNTSSIKESFNRIFNKINRKKSNKH